MEELILFFNRILPFFTIEFLSSTYLKHLIVFKAILADLRTPKIEKQPEGCFSFCSFLFLNY